MKRIFTFIVYLSLRGAAEVVAMLPWRALYALSDAAAPFLYHIVRYRRRVVRSNIDTSLPERSLHERRVIERAFYRFLCDYVMETLKLLRVKPEELLRHIEFRGAEEIERCFDAGQSCAALLGHYCNWEWLSATGLAMTRHKEAVMGLIYHPLYNKAVDRLFIHIRRAMGGVCVPKHDIPRFLLRYREERRPSLFGYIGDQAPKWENMHLWLTFLHHDTGVFTGGERLMRKMNNAVFYADMERTRRGHYICSFRPITRDIASIEAGGVTRRFFSLLEESIRRDPRYYLWSHDRWRRTHDEYKRRFNIT